MTQCCLQFRVNLIQRQKWCFGCAFVVESVGINIWPPFYEILATFGVVDQPLASCCRFDILDNISSFVSILTYAIIYVLIHHIIFWLYLYFLNILYLFKYIYTNIFHRRSLCNFYSFRLGLPFVGRSREISFRGYITIRYLHFTFWWVH